MNTKPRFKLPQIPTNVVTITMAGLILMASGGMGGAYAAAQFTGADIKNGTITGSDLKNGSVSGTDLKNGSVKAADLATNSVGAAEIAPDSVKAAALAPNAVDSTALAPNSVDSSALRRDSVTTENLTGDAEEAVETVLDATTETQDGQTVLGAGRLIYSWSGDATRGDTPRVLEHFSQAVFTYSVNSATRPGTYTIVFGSQGDTGAQTITCSVAEASVEFPGSCTATAVIYGLRTMVTAHENHPGGAQSTLVGIQVSDAAGNN